MKWRAIAIAGLVCAVLVGLAIHDKLEEIQQRVTAGREEVPGQAGPNRAAGR